MKGIIYLKNTDHEFRKVNLVSLKNGHDKYKCAKCGIQAIRPGLTDYVNVSNCQKKLFLNCDGSSIKDKEPFKSYTIKLTRDIPVQDDSLTRGSEHNTIEKPAEHKDVRGGIWIMGKKEPVRIMDYEYETK